MTPPSQNHPTPDAAPAGTDDAGTDDAAGTPGEFGPRGYVPPKAAARARKIVLREQMGLHWTIAAVVAGVLILGVVIPAVVVSGRAPQPPFAEVGALAQVDPAGSALLEVDGVDVLVVRGGGVLAAFADPPASAAYCPASRRIEAPGGGVWSLGGRPLGAVDEGLQPVGAVAFDDSLWINLEERPPVASGGGDLAPACT